MSQIIWTQSEVTTAIGSAFRSKAEHRPSAKRGSNVKSGDTRYEGVFRTELKTKDLRGRALRRATEQALPTLMPTDLKKLIIFARPSIDGAHVELAAVRKADLETNGGVDKSWVSLAADWRALTPRGLKTAKSRRFVFAASILTTFAASIFSYATLLSAFDRKMESLSVKERSVRDQAVETALADQDAERWVGLKSELASMLQPAEVLRLQSKLAEATPDTAHWRTFSWSSGQIRIEGRGADPLDVLEAMADVDGISAARFAGPLEALDAQSQRFSITLELDVDGDAQ